MLTVNEIQDLMFELFLKAIQLARSVLIASMLVGVIISILQAATQIHKQTITFVPKLIAIGVILVVYGSTILEMLQDFTRKIFVLIVGQP